MNKHTVRVTLQLTTATLVFAICSAQALAQTRTWVSGVGDDLNPCSRTAPCKTFAGAISKTAAGGEISVLDPGGFGAVTITKAITINGYGSLAGILAASVNGIIVNAGVNDEVIIKNISILGAGTGLDGIRFLAGNQLTVENVTISGFNGDAIEGFLTAGAKFYVKDTNITNCGGAGFKLGTSAGFVTAVLDNVRIEGLVNGVEIGVGNTFTSINRSVIITNTSNGVIVDGPGIVNVENSMLSFNGTGVNANAASSLIRISGNGIYHNGVGVKFIAGGTVASDGTNRISGNGSTSPPNGVITIQ